MRYSSLLTLALVLAIVATAGGCSVRKFVAKQVGHALSEGSSVYASDDDIQLVGDALPFGLKTIEALLAQVPDDHDLLVAAASGFVQYAYIYVDTPAFEIEDQHPQRARTARHRAKRLYLRGYRYALRALDLRARNFEQQLRTNPQAVLATVQVNNVPELYWAGVALSAAISADKQDLDLVADLNLVGPMMQRCLQLNEAFDEGAIHQFMITFDGSRSAAQGGSISSARAHFERAMELAHGQQVSPLVDLAESVSVATQNRKEFEQLLRQALAFDADKAPAHRLANLVAQERARVLLARIDDYFIGN
jgi:predicted anti-sigma-YlaC factor YlaD